MSVGPTLAHLRRATSAIHERLETRLHVIPRLSSPDQRPALLQAYGAFHRSAEQALRPWLGNIPGLAFDLRRRTFAEETTALRFPPMQSQAEALGALYVVEGSSLGGRIILRQLSAAGVSLAGLGFLDPYGDVAGKMWRDFLVVLEERAGGEPEAAERGALAAFAFAESCLCETVPA